MKRGGKTKQKKGRHITNTFMGAGSFDNKHGVGIMLNKNWRHRVVDTEYINERVISTSIVVNRQHIKLMSVYFTPLGVSRKCTRRSRSKQQIAKDTYPLLEETSMQNWDQDTERNVSVLAGTHSTRETKEVIG